MSSRPIPHWMPCLNIKKWLLKLTKPLNLEFIKNQTKSNHITKKISIYIYNNLLLNNLTRYAFLYMDNISFYHYKLSAYDYFTMEVYK